MQEKYEFSKVITGFTKTFDDNGHLMFTNVEVENESGVLYYRTTEDGKEPSNILAVLYEKPTPRSILEEKVAEIENQMAEIEANGTTYESDAVKDGIREGNIQYSQSKNVTENQDATLSQAEMD